MKFTGALSTLLVVLPFLVLQSAAAPSAGLEERFPFRKGRGRGGVSNLPVPHIEPIAD